MPHAPYFLSPLFDMICTQNKKNPNDLVAIPDIEGEAAEDLDAEQTDENTAEGQATGKKPELPEWSDDLLVKQEPPELLAWLDKGSPAEELGGSTSDMWDKGLKTVKDTIGKKDVRDPALSRSAQRKKEGDWNKLSRDGIGRGHNLKDSLAQESRTARDISIAVAQVNQTRTAEYEMKLAQYNANVTRITAIVSALASLGGPVFEAALKELHELGQAPQPPAAATVDDFVSVCVC